MYQTSPQSQTLQTGSFRSQKRVEPALWKAEANVAIYEIPKLTISTYLTYDLHLHYMASIKYLYNGILLSCHIVEMTETTIIQPAQVLRISAPHWRYSQ